MIGRPRTPNEIRRYASLHEAGHATAALALGASVDKISIVDGQLEGATRVCVEGLSRDEKVMISLGGYTANEGAGMWLPCFPRTADYRQAFSFANVDIDFTQVDLPHYLSGIRSDTHRLLQARSVLLLELADALFAAGLINAAGIAEIASRQNV